MSEGTHTCITHVMALTPPSSPGLFPSQYLSLDDQQFLFEAVGILVLTAPVDTERKAAILSALTDPMFRRFVALSTDDLPRAPDQPTQRRCADLLHHVMAIMVSLGKAVTGPEHLEASGCGPLFARALELFMPALQLPVQRAVIRAGIRVYLHRMVVSMGEAVLAVMPSVVGALLGPGAGQVCMSACVCVCVGGRIPSI